MSKLTRDELLVLLIEECAEVIQAATKCLRFGWDRNYPGYGVNHEKLADEIGELGAVTNALNLNRYRVVKAAGEKMARAEKAKAELGQHEDEVARQAYLNDPHWSSVKD